MPVILALGRLRQENFEFEARLGYVVRFHLKKQECNLCFRGKLSIESTILQRKIALKDPVVDI
jgi:hypothetical protein